MIIVCSTALTEKLESIQGAIVLEEKAIAFNVVLKSKVRNLLKVEKKGFIVPKAT